MNILLINHYAGSPELGMEFRPYYLANEWIKKGHHVLVIGASFSHLRKKQPHKRYERIGGVPVYWAKTTNYKGNGLGRICSMILFVLQLYFLPKKLFRKFKVDVVIASSTYPLDNYPARKIARKNYAKYIYEIHDLWPLSPMELGGYSKHHPFVMVMQRAENYAFKNCDAVVSMLPKAEEHCRQHGLKEGKFHYVPNGIVKSDWENPTPLPKEHERLIKRLKSENKFLIGYAGAHGIANSLKAIIDAVADMENENVALLMVGTGQEKEKLTMYVKNEKIGNVFFLSPIVKNAIPSFLGQMDVLYIGLQKQSLFRFGISPNKIFDYMMAQKPVIQAIDAGNNPVKEADCGISVEPDNVEKIKTAISTLLHADDDERIRLGKNGFSFVNRHHTYDVLGRRFLEIMIKLK